MSSFKFRFLRCSHHRRIQRIGATYADRLAKRGYDLVLVARDCRPSGFSAHAAAGTGVNVTVLPCRSDRSEDLRELKTFIRANPQISLLVNNAGPRCRRF